MKGRGFGVRENLNFRVRRERLRLIDLGEPGSFSFADGERGHAEVEEEDECAGDNKDDNHCH